jgi:translation initiation factor IF-1
MDTKEWGTIEEVLPELNYKVKLANGRILRCYTAGKLIKNRIRCGIGDRVEVVVPTTGDIGRVVWRK